MSINLVLVAGDVLGRLIKRQYPNGFFSKLIGRDVDNPRVGSIAGLYPIVAMQHPVSRAKSAIPSSATPNEDSRHSGELDQRFTKENASQQAAAIRL